MKSFLVAACLVIAGTGLTEATAYAAANDNSAAATLCQKGGYANFRRTDFTLFTNVGACVTYVNKGGKLLPNPATLVLNEPTIITKPQCWDGATVGVTPVVPALFDTHTWGNTGAILCFQADGNLVIYKAGHVGDPASALWNAGTFNNPDAYLAFQGDGNFVIYTTNGLPIWNSTTWGHPGDCVIFQGDGNLVVYTGCTVIGAFGPQYRPAE